MSHAILDGPVDLLKIVTPGAYWIKCAACEGSSRVPSSIKHKIYASGPEGYYPHQGDKVFVHDKDGFFYRGTVCGRRQSSESESRGLLGTWKYVVQLTDTFQVKDFHQHDVYPTYGEDSASCESAHLVCLYHVLPQMPPTTYGKIGADGHKPFETVVLNWDKYVASMTRITEKKVKLSFELCKVINRCIYGKISTSPPILTETKSQCFNLADYIHLETFGIHVTFRFDDVVGALMSNRLIDYDELLPTFDPSGKTSLKPKPALPVEKEKPRVPEELSGYKVHPDDVELHESLHQGNKYFVNIFFSGAPLEDDTIIRYVSPDGKVVLGTVIGIDLKHAEESSDRLFNYSQLAHTSQDEEPFYSEHLFEKLDFSDSSDEPENPLTCYDFDETFRRFKAAGGVFEDRFLPYRLSRSVEDVILQSLGSLGVESLHDWQKLCLHAFSSRKNLIVVGPESTGKLLTAVICGLSWINHYRSDSDSIHPQVIMFFNDVDRADETAVLCKKLFSHLGVIVSASSIISLKQKEDAKKGCNVLITTPSNWAKLYSQGVFDYSRLKHAIFDEFDVLYKLHAEDVVNILHAIESSSSRVQAIAVANRWSEFMRATMTDTVLCLMDVLFSCIYYKLTLSAVFVAHGDWAGLREVINKEPSGKRLLLCKDQTEGQLIVENLSQIQSVVFVNEALDKEAALKKFRDWDRNGDKFLVCTDACIEGIDFKNVDLLISWMTNSKATWSNRFKVFVKNFGFTSCLSSASAYIFCDSSNLEQLLLLRSTAPNARFVNGSLEEHVNRASFAAENVKLTAVCPSVFMFGKCHAVPACPNRHVLKTYDHAMSSHLSQFLKVNILKVHSAFKYSVRVTEVISNCERKDQNGSVTDRMFKYLKALISNLKDIEGWLIRCFKKPLSPPLRVIQMVGIKVVRGKKTVLRRGLIKSIPEDAESGLYELSIIDYGEPDERVRLSQLFALPREAASFPKDVVDLYISGLAPADPKSDWKNDTCNFVVDVTQRLTDHLDFFAGKVHLVTADRTALVDSLHCFKDGPVQKTLVSLVETDFRSLKDLILESGYCVKNLAHLPLLSELLDKSAAPSYDSVHPQTAIYSPHYMLSDHKGRFGFRCSMPAVPVEAVVSSFEDPGLLYVQLTEESQKLNDFENALSSSLNRSRTVLPLVAVDELCAVLHQGAWNRAIIFDVIGDIKNPVRSVRIMFVDHGDTIVDVLTSDLYCLPDKFLDVPFFAIQCQLVGIKPLVGDEWDEETVDLLLSYIRTRDDTVKEVLVQFCGPADTEEVSKFYCKQSVVLWGLNEPESVNFRLARRGLAKFDKDTKHLLKKRSLKK